MMGFVVFLVLTLSLAGYSSANWCICRQGLTDPVLQKTLDYACGAGADCTLIHEKGVCFSPNTVWAHCSYAVNSFYQKKNQAPTTCDFAGATRVVTNDPSTGGGCSYPASQSAAGTSTNPSRTPSTTTNPSTSTTPISNTPYNAMPTNGFGAFNSGLAPTGTDYNHGGVPLQSGSFVFSCFKALLFSGLVFVWG